MCLVGNRDHSQTYFRAFVASQDKVPLCVTVVPIPHSSNTTLHPAFYTVMTDRREYVDISGVTWPDCAVFGSSGR